MDTIIIPITDFIRNSKHYSDLLTKVNQITLTREGRPFADVIVRAEEKNKQLLSLRGKWDGSLFDNDDVWKAVAVRRNRKRPIKL